MKKIMVVLCFVTIGVYAMAQNNPTWDDTHSKDWPKECNIISIPSTLDAEEQPAYFYKSKANNRPLIISLHTWSGGFEQRDSLSWQCIEKDFNYIHPHFRGPNWTPKACGSKYAIQDIEDAIAWVIANGNVDTNEIHVVGTSGGGYATLLTYMNTNFNVKTFSAWVPISNIEDWYYESVGRGNKYAREMAIATTGKDFGKEDDYYLNVDEARERSPYYMPTPIEKRKESKLSIYAGIHDGYTGSVPISQSLKFYNKVVLDYDSSSTDIVTSDEIISLLSRRNTNFENPEKVSLGDVHFTRSYNDIVTITIFEGTHQMLLDRAIGHVAK